VQPGRAQADQLVREAELEVMAEALTDPEDEESFETDEEIEYRNGSSPLVSEAV